MKLAVLSKTNFISGSRVVAEPRSRCAVSRQINVKTQAFISDVSKYLSDAASQIFSPMKDDVPWTSQDFAGKIEHHETKNLHYLVANVRSVRRELEQSVDILSDDENEAATNEIELPVAGQYISASIAKLFDPKAKVNSAEPAKYYSGGYRSRGRTQREVRRDINKLRRFEEVIDKAIEKGE